MAYTVVAAYFYWVYWQKSLISSHLFFKGPGVPDFI